MLMADDRIFSLIKVVLITTCTLCMMSSLTVFKYPIKKVLGIFGVYLLWVLLSSGVILALFPYNTGIRIFLLTISAPAVFIAYRMDKDSPTQSVFNYTTQINFSLLLGVLALMLNTAIKGNQATDLLIRVLLYAVVIYLECRFIRKPFRHIAEVITSGWGVLSFIPVFFCMLIALIATVPVHFSERPINVIYIFAIAVTMLVIYMVVYQSLMRQYQLQMQSRDRDVLAVQISAMNKQADAVFAAEDKLRILRHDVRHFTEAMHSLLRQGGTEQAQAVLSTLEAAVRDSTYRSYCEDYMINSILAPYLDAAEQEGIAVKVNFAAPPTGKIDSTAFSVMLANALENALEACRQETESRSIELKARMFNGQYLLELSNTCRAVVQFNKDGLPLSRKGEGHGIGTRSIAAYAKEQDASVNFYTENNRFILQMILGVEG